MEDVFAPLRTVKGFPGYDRYLKSAQTRQAKAENARRWRLNRFGLTEPQVAAIWTAQGGVCRVCQEPTWKPCKDHDHATGRFRGLVCGACNLMLGHAHDDPNVLTAGARYLAVA